MDNDDDAQPIRDTGSYSRGHVAEEEIAGHHSDRWQSHAMYVGLHFPNQRGKRRHRKHKKSRSSGENGGEKTSTPTPAAGTDREPVLPPTPPSSRVQFLLGQEDDDEEHQIHDIFCEMEELRDGVDGELEWKETARWIKFEEDVEEGGERWSKPHVATLSLHSLFELRKGILSGTVMLDVEVNNIVQLTDILLDNMISSNQLEEKFREEVQNILLMRHRHQHQKPKGLPMIRSLADIGKKRSESRMEGKDDYTRRGSMPANVFLEKERQRQKVILVRWKDILLSTDSSDSNGSERSNSSGPSTSNEQSTSQNGNVQSSSQNVNVQSQSASQKGNGSNHNQHRRHSLDPQALHRTDQDGLKTSSSSSHLTPGHKNSSFARKNSSKDIQNIEGIDTVPSTHKFNEHFLKKIPPGAEASNILVGEVDFLTYPIIAFVRLQKACLLGDLTEVPVPTRFVFVLLGPTGNQQRYHEIGRSIATLMSDEVFHEIAYRAQNRGDLLAGIDEFLDQVTVLPPGEWDPSIRIEPPKSVPSQEARRKPKPPPGGDKNGEDKNGLPNGGPGPVKEEEQKEEEHGDPTLVRTGRIFGGLVNDVKRKLGWYKSDITDALHIQCVASFFFMYFACLTPIITFGGLLGSATDNNMAAMESLMSGAICGITYHIFSGQPLTIIGSTGPVLVFETIVFNFTTDNGLDYLAFRFWIGIWVAVALFLMVMFDLSSLVRYITRFTEESFATLIALIFIVEAFKKLFHIADYHPPNLHPHQELDYTCFCVPDYNSSAESNTTVHIGEPIPVDTAYHAKPFAPAPVYNLSNYNMTDNDTIMAAEVIEEECLHWGGMLEGSGCDTTHYIADVFFFSCLLFIGTFAIAMSLKFSRNSRFFPTIVRSIISDFAVMIAIVSMVVADILVGLETPKLLVPPKVRPTRDDRDWVINPFVNPVWCIPAAILPALLATILIFMDQQITAVIVNRKENKLKKGGGYHLDLLVIAIQIAVCSVLGTPWFVAATVLSINHVRSLTKESESSAPGEKPKFLGIREQRVTGSLVFLMVGLSAFLSIVLKYIPMAVLYGVFLYMGVSSMKGVQLLQRVFIMLMPPKYQPDYIFLRHVPLPRVHLFTCIQVICLAVLWVIKTIKSVSIVFPLMVLAMCFVRKALDYVFSRHELKWLDDIMPESHKKDKEEKHKQIEELLYEEEKEEPKDHQVIDMSGGMVRIPLADGKMVTIPVNRLTFDPKTNQVSIDSEASKSHIWHQLASESDPKLPSLGEYQLRSRSDTGGRKDMKKPEKTEPKEVKKPLNIDHNNDILEEEEPRKPAVKFHIADENDETDHLMGTPDIVVDPPSKSSSRNDIQDSNA